MDNNKQEEKKPTYSSVVPAVEQASQILICLGQAAPSKMNLTDIAKKVGVHKSKAYSILNTLQKFGLVLKEAESKYYTLGPGLISLGRKVLDSLNLRELAAPFLQRLAGTTHNTTCFGLISDDNVFVVGRQEGDADIGLTIRIGHRYRITHGAHGKVILAFASEAERERILAQGDLYFHGDPSRFDRDRLDKELIRSRKEGYAEDMGEMNPKINTVAAPVFTSGGRVIGVVFVVGLFERSSVKQYGALVAEAGIEMSGLLGANVAEIQLKRAGKGPSGNNQK